MTDYLTCVEPNCLTTTVLVENAPVEDLRSEHGLSVHLSYRRDNRTTQVLLDFGQSDAFALNAAALGIDLAAVQFSVLSHAHYDHADGMPSFFARNTCAPLYLSAACAETCWSTKGGTAEAHYIGIGIGLLDRFADRMVHVPTDRPSTIAPGMHLVPHTTPGLADLGKQAGMLLREEDEWMPDSYAHELSLVFELSPAEDGAPRLAVFNSCSHGGLPAIIGEVHAASPCAHIAAFVGGLHLIHASDEEIVCAAQTAREAGIERLYTGHCTGTHALNLLQEELPNRVVALGPGLQFML